MKTQLNKTHLEDEDTAQTADASREGGGLAHRGLPDMDDATEAAITLGLNATIGRWDAGLQKHIDVPDPRTRLEAAKLYLSYKIGMPLARRLRIEGTFKDRQTELIETARTPTGRAVLVKLGLIDEAWLKSHVSDDSH